MKPMTIKEMQSKGGKARAAKYGKEEKRRWSMMGIAALKAKYGADYFKIMSLKGVEARKRKAKLQDVKQDA